MNENLEKVIKRVIGEKNDRTVHTMLYECGVRLRDDPKLMRTVDLALSMLEYPQDPSTQKRWLMFKIAAVEYWNARPFPSGDAAAEKAEQYLREMPWLRWVKDNDELSEEDKQQAELEAAVNEAVCIGGKMTAKEIAENVVVKTGEKFGRVYSLVLRMKKVLKQSTKEVVKEARPVSRRGRRPKTR
jgi:hypothetical protein